MGKKWVDSLKILLNESKVIDDPDHIELYIQDESGLTGKVKPEVVVHPENPEDVEKTVRFAHKRNIPVVARGGGTGLTGGAVPLFGGIVIVFDRMNQILEINPKSLYARVQPGVITGEFQERVESMGLFYPPDPASLDSCTIGGNVAENASGPRTLKYGVTQHYVLELETVFPTGERLRVGKPVKKWVVGYNLIGLLVGSEGTLGIFTEVTLRLIPKPSKIITALLPFEDEEKASLLVGEILSLGTLPRSLEFLDRKSLHIVRDMLPPNIPEDTGAILILELDGNDDGVLISELEKIGDGAFKIGAYDILIARTSKEKERLWKGRRELYKILEERYQRVRSEDLVVPRHLFHELIKRVYQIESETGVDFCTFGHAGDGNLHVNLLYTDEDIKSGRLDNAIKKLYEVTNALHGTISGEHGIGLLKKHYIGIEQPTFLIELQREIKKLLDQKGILNPGKIFPSRSG